MLLISVLVSRIWIFELFQTDVASSRLFRKVLGLIVSASCSAVISLVSTLHAYKLAIALSDPFSFLFWRKETRGWYIFLQEYLRTFFKLKVFTFWDTIKNKQHFWLIKIITLGAKIVSPIISKLFLNFFWSRIWYKVWLFCSFFHHFLCYPMLLWPVRVSIIWISKLFQTYVAGCRLLGKMLGLVVSASMIALGSFVSTAHACEIAVELSDPISFLSWRKKLGWHRFLQECLGIRTAGRVEL